MPKITYSLTSPGPYTLLYWQYDCLSGDPLEEPRKTTRAPQHLSLDELCCIDVASVCAESTLLLLRLPARVAVAGLDLFKAWGFRYRSCLVWSDVKQDDTLIDSYRFSSVREVLYLATRGDHDPKQLDELLQALSATRETPNGRIPVRRFLDARFSAVARAELLPKEARHGWEPLYIKEATHQPQTTS